jgi:maleate cis-trans isomerase
MSVISTHNYGFFSCTTLRFYDIINFINANNKLPVLVDSSAQFGWYKQDMSKDITFEYF